MGTQRLTETMEDSSPSVYYSLEFQSMLENHIPSLVRGLAVQILPVEPSRGHQYEGDFFGLLTSLSIPSQYHWVTMRCNNLYSPTDYRSTMANIVCPAFDEVDEIYAIFTSSSGLQMG